MPLLRYVITRVRLRMRRALRPLTIVTTGHGYRMRVDLRDEFVARELFANKVWEPELQKLAACAELEGGVAVDVGANVGAHTLHFSALAGPTGSVYAFEPEPYNFNLLDHNVRLNNLSNVIAQRKAVGDVVSMARMQIAKSNWGDHRITTGEGDIEVPTVTLDDVLPASTVGRVRLIKVDVQGHEPHVFNGMRGTLERNPDVIVITEIFPLYLKDAGSSASKFLEVIEAVGLRGWEVNSYRIAPIAPGWVYERFLGRKEETLVLSRNAERLAKVLSCYLGGPVAVQ